MVTDLAALSLDDQLRLFDKYARQSSLAQIAFMGNHRDAMLSLARERLSSIGFAEYGDKSFRKSNRELFFDRLEEGADMIVYGVPRLARHYGELA